MVPWATRVHIQMASQSVQAFLQGSRLWQTDWLTDGQTDHATPSVTSFSFVYDHFLQQTSTRIQTVHPVLSCITEKTSHTIHDTHCLVLSQTSPRYQVLPLTVSTQWCTCVVSAFGHIGIWLLGTKAFGTTSVAPCNVNDYWHHKTGIKGLAALPSGLCCQSVDQQRTGPRVIFTGSCEYIQFHSVLWWQCWSVMKGIQIKNPASIFSKACHL